MFARGNCPKALVSRSFPVQVWPICDVKDIRLSTAAQKSWYHNCGRWQVVRDLAPPLLMLAPCYRPPEINIAILHNIA